MNDKDLLINIKDSSTYKEFKSIVLKSFKLNANNNIDIYYFNSFGIKKYIQNEYEFKKTLSQNVFKYYIIRQNTILNSVLSSDNIPNKNQEKHLQFRRQY